MTDWILRNPFFLKERWVWAREMSGWALRGTRFAATGAIAAPFALVYLLAAFGLVTQPFSAGWALSAACWLALTTVLAVSAGIHVYPRERDLGALEVASLTPTSPWREAVGRFAGAFIGVFEGWTIGVLLVALSAFVFDVNGLQVVSVWIFSLFWFAGLTATALFWSAASRTSSAALSAVLTTMVLVNMGYTIAAGKGLPLDLLRVLPLNLCGFAAAFASAQSGDDWMWSLEVLCATWSLFVLVALDLTTYLIFVRAPLQVGPTPQGAVGLLPANPNVPPPARPRDRATTIGGGLTDRLLRRFNGNPFYHAYRNGFLRLFAGQSAAPGNVAAAGAALTGPLFFVMLCRSELNAAVNVLLAILALASSVGVAEGLVLGARALTSEREQSTWPMLVVSGIRPSTVLRGKFAAAFYALSGEWALALPVWLFALPMGHPGILLLALVQPAAIAMGILVGLWMSSQPRYLLISIDRILLALAALFGTLWCVRILVLDNPRVAAMLVHYLSPLATTAHLATDPLHGLLQFGTVAVLYASCMLALWSHTARRLTRVLRGE